MDIVTLALAKAYANKVAAGYSSIIAEGNTLIFKYNDGTEAKVTIPAVEGKSAYQIWLEQGNTGTEQDFLNVLKGEQGPKGEDGLDGYTPVKGVDYWNEEDKQEVKGFIDNSIMKLENVLRDILEAIQNNGTIEEIEQLIISYFEDKTIEEVEG